jgi:hypothetical protein
MNTRRSANADTAPAPDNQPPAESDSTSNGVLPGLAPRWWGWPSSHALLILVAIIMGFWIGLIAGSSRQEFAIDSPTLNQCMTNTISLLDLKQAPNTALLNEVVGHCYSLLRSQGLLRDFAVRELNFIQQYRANGVMMWMVVAVTISGVLLAGLQLMASYQLASSNKTSFGEPNEFTLSRDRVILKSSITGLFILLISFAFFLVFVTYVYRFENLEDRSVRGPQQVPTLPMGQLGAPPPAAK